MQTPDRDGAVCLVGARAGAGSRKGRWLAVGQLEWSWTENVDMLHLGLTSAGVRMLTAGQVSVTEGSSVLVPSLRNLDRGMENIGM